MHRGGCTTCTGGGAQHAPKHNHLSFQDLKERKKEAAAAEAAAALSQISVSIESENQTEEHDEIYEALLENVPRFVYVADNITAGLMYIDEFYVMLQQREFQNMKSPDLIRLACEIYHERTCRLDGQNVILKHVVDQPAGMFHRCYKEAYKLYKARRGRSIRELLQKDV